MNACLGLAEYAALKCEEIEGALVPHVFFLPQAK